MNAVPLFEFPEDPKLKYAYRAHEAVLEAFQKAYKRQPACGLFIGNGIGKTSTVTARWDKGVDASADALKLRELAEDVITGLSA
jgi:hypothetical protein